MSRSTTRPSRLRAKARRSGLARLAAAALLVCGLAGASPAGAAVLPPASLAPAVAAAFDPAAVNLALTALAGRFAKPVHLTHAGDGSGRLFVVEQGGKIRIISSGGSVVATPFLDISSSVSKGSEQGLLGLAFHPDFETNGKLYVNFTTTTGATAINEYRVASDPNRAGSGRRLLTISQPYSNHNGGHIAFGPDGFLYIGMGDGGSAGDPGNRAQSLSSLLGKMLRIDVNGTSGSRQYRIPSTNPYVGRTGLDEIWSRGLRNPWRWSFDGNGWLWIGDVGQNRWEEINRSTRVDGYVGRGVNYGWKVLEGRACHSPSSGCSKTGKAMPLAVYAHAVGGADNCSVTGGYVYRGTAHPALAGGYLFGDFCSGRIWGLSATAASPAAPVLMRDTSLFISSFGEDEARNLYVLDLNGKIYRLSGTLK